MQFRVDRVYVETDRAAPGEVQDDRARSVLAGLKTDRQELDHRVLRLCAQVEAFDRAYIVEMGAGPRAPERPRPLVAARLPQEPVRNESKTPRARQVGEIADLGDSILQAGGDDFQVIRIRRHQPQGLIISEVRHEGLFLDALNERAALDQFFFQPFKAAVKMIDAVDDGLPFRAETGEDKAH